MIVLAAAAVLAVLAVGAAAVYFLPGQDRAGKNAPLAQPVTRAAFIYDVVEKGEVESSRNVEVRCEVNEEVRQLGRTKDLIFDIPTLVSYASHVMTLLPGDVLLTGTPAGVSPIVAGDTCTVRIEGIGELANPVAALE